MPILREIEERRLEIVGTGFYVSRYGLLMTARHVVETLVDDKGSELGVGFILHWTDERVVHLRQIKSASFLNHPGADVAIVQADNYVQKYNENPLLNLRVRLSTMIHASGSPVVTYAYPENEILDFNDEDNVPTVVSDYSDGELLRYAEDSENPSMPYPHFETSIEIRGGASGGPVFSAGRVIGVNCRGWDFGGAEHEGDNLSSIVPIEQALNLRVDLTHLPERSWEHGQIPDGLRGSDLSVAELAAFGHIDLEVVS